MQTALLDTKNSPTEPFTSLLPSDKTMEREAAVIQNLRHADYLSVTMLSSRLLEKTILSCGITPTQYRILLRLMVHNGSLRVGRLAEMLDIGASTVTATVAQLAEMDAVQRVEDHNDLRAVHVLITPVGIKKALTTEQVLAPLVEKIRKSIPSGLRTYVSTCTLRVAEKHDLFGNEKRHVSVSTALCDEVLLTATLASHITREEGLSLTGYRLLLALFDEESGARPNQLAYDLNLRTNVITAAQGELFRRGFIDRARDLRDHRAVLIEITSDGYTVLRRTSRAVAMALETQICSNMDIDDFVKHRHIANSILDAQRPQLV